MAAEMQAPENTDSLSPSDRPEHPSPSIFFRRISAPDRLGLPYSIRLPVTITAGFSVGMALGLPYGSTKAAFRYRAENSHRFPTSKSGWYLYHRTKSYHSALGAVKEGLKLGPKIAAGTAAFFALEELVDQARDTRDFFSTLTAGLTFSGIYSLVARQDIYTAGRNARLALKWSLVYGLAQDALSLMKGNRLGYVDVLLGRRRSSDPVI